ncbi:MAG: hypothetical protein KGZ80_12505 [Methylomonas sp.]|nr:hypothetical protein [Methylomonas sp.]
MYLLPAQKPGALCLLSLSLSMLLATTTVSAESVADIQKRLNEEVLQKPFSAETEANLNAYIQEATKRGTPPKTEPSRFWRRGYTCADLRRHSWTDYRDCSYYHRFYGRYWPY